MRFKVAHLTSVHNRYDTRIFIKQCKSLAKFYDTHLIVADGCGNECIDMVNIYDVGEFKDRKDRILNAPRAVYKKAISLNADMYHLHDPELLPIALKLKGLGKKVIFDAHEDFPKQLLSKSYLNIYMAKTISISMRFYEKYACSKLDAVISATPTINDKFSLFSKIAVNINNYPILGELQPLTKDWNVISNDVAYIGNISKIRGIQQLVNALGLLETNTILNLGGSFADTDTREAVQSSIGWKLVNELGQLNREEVKKVLENSIAGIVNFLPAPNHIDAQPNKMFEYMSAGIPVIASNFPLWIDIIEGNQCGICINPNDSKSIAKAIDTLILNKDLAESMGKNGIKAVNEKYNWAVEEVKLFDLYKELLKDNI